MRTPSRTPQISVCEKNPKQRCIPGKPIKTRGLGILCWDPSLSGRYQSCSLGIHRRRKLFWAKLGKFLQGGGGSQQGFFFPPTSNIPGKEGENNQEGKEFHANGNRVQAPRGSKQCFPNGVFQIPHLGFRQRKTPPEGQIMPENANVFLFILVPSSLADPDHALNTPLWKTPFRKHHLLLLGSQWGSYSANGRISAF